MSVENPANLSRESRRILNEEPFPGSPDDTMNTIAALRARVAKLEAALKRLVADYQDVPDPTDADGQQVFAEARAALKDAPQ